MRRSEARSYITRLIVDAIDVTFGDARDPRENKVGGDAIEIEAQPL